MEEGPRKNLLFCLFTGVSGGNNPRHTHFRLNSEASSISGRNNDTSVSRQRQSFGGGNVCEEATEQESLKEGDVGHIDV